MKTIFRSHFKDPYNSFMRSVLINIVIGIMRNRRY